MHMLTAATSNLKYENEIKPFMEAVFYVKDEQTLDEFWSFMMKEEGLTKTIEFIMHICSEVLYEKKNEITIEFSFFKYVSYFKISNHSFSRKTMEHYLKIRAFLSVEIDDDAVILKSLRDNDKIDCRFCKALKDDDPKITHNLTLKTEMTPPCHTFFEVDAESNRLPEGISDMQRCPIDLNEEFGFDELHYLNDELTELEIEIFETLGKMNKKTDMSMLHPVSLKIFIYSQKLLASVEFYELSITMRSLSFLIQKLFMSDYERAKKPLMLCECMLSDISNWRKSTLEKGGKINAHYLDVSLASSLAQIEEIIGKLQ
ncbi:MAG: hypothetical protein AB7D29_04040 [Campylobacterales bacterium]